jgi:hypothetical protein
MFAQDIRTTLGNEAPKPNPVDGVGALLYDQNTAVGVGTIATQQFGDFPTFSCQAADDFVVPASGWEIQQINCTGSGTGAFTTALVEFYADGGTTPGSVVSTQTASIVNSGGNLTVTLSPFVQLPAGTYWVSVSVIGDFGTFGQWYWFTHMTNNNDLWCWQNPGGGFGAPCPAWGQHTACFPGSYTDNDLAFQLHGVVLPVELTSFTAAANENEVVLNWITATETNNQGFSIERSSGGEYQAIGFVQGHGTTTETQAYSYIDKNVNTGSYSYRLKQIDFDGTFEYSDAVEVDVTAPKEFVLAQNYPNPFNPSTKISFSLAADSRVILSIFNLLGEEVATVLNSNMVAGSHSIDFNAVGLNSGVYFYRINAQGIDGTNFTSVKKMILTK